MIPKDYITEWRTQAPWVADEQVEQDLVISRAIVEMFGDGALARRLAWRGGTALHKLYFAPAPRYSEDIDLVQLSPEPIGDTLHGIRSALDPWLGEPKRVFKEGRVNLVYRFRSEGPPIVPLRMKIEINTREHFSELGVISMPFEIESRWFAGKTDVTTFALDELLGTKLRALYQRKKGRDIFDLWTAATRGRVSPDRVVRCFERYMREGGHSASRAQFEQNLAGKRADRNFTADTTPLLRPGTPWDPDAAFDVVQEWFVSRLSGTSWRSLGE